MHLYRILAGVVFLTLLPSAPAQQVTLTSAGQVLFPAPVDSNSPALWLGEQFVIFNSTGNGPMRSMGSSQFALEQTQPVVLGPSIHKPYWIEATWRDTDGIVYGWYHHEPSGVCGSLHLTAPQIGALVSYDGGRSFYDLGIILSNGNPPDCSAQNGYFAGGNGDFTVMLGRNKRYLYFLFSNYAGPKEEQGVAIARLPVERRGNPYGAVEKFYRGQWLEPGIGGHVTAIYRAKVSWSNPNTDAFWGPSVHWNSYLNTFVMLLNRSCCGPGWPQEGVYISYNPSLANPLGWSKPVRILEGGAWYPQVVGIDRGESDKLAGKKARLYTGGVSDWEIEFDLQ